jgi:hypothetical protein
MGVPSDGKAVDAKVLLPNVLFQTNGDEPQTNGEVHIIFSSKIHTHTRTQYHTYFYFSPQGRHGFCRISN